MKKMLFLVFGALCLLITSCSKDAGFDYGQDPPDALLKNGHTHGPVVVIPPSGGNDTYELLTAINAAEPGTVIQLTEGTYTIDYIEVYGFAGTLKGAGRNKTILIPGNVETVPQINRNLLGTWWRIIGGDVTISDLSFRTGDGSPIDDIDPWYTNALSCVLAINNYNMDYQPLNPQPMNFKMTRVDIIGGKLNPDQTGYAGCDYNVIMSIWLGTDVYWPVGDVILTSGSYNISDCYLEYVMDGFESFSFGENAVLIADRNRIHDCLTGIYCTASYNSRIFLKNNVLSNELVSGIFIEDQDYGLLGNIHPFKSCEYVVTGNRFFIPEGSVGLEVKDNGGVMHPDIYQPIHSLIKNNIFSLTGGSTGVSCENSVNAVVRNNCFSGEGKTGVYVDGVMVTDGWTGEPIGMGEAKNALILGNNFTGLSATDADIVLGEMSSNCTVVGNGKESVIDLGTDNKIVSMKRVYGGYHSGPAIRNDIRMMPPIRHHL